MPLASNLPVIDNRRYDELVAELRTRIPRYTPEWTDFNDSDPGITLIQLFAWLSDMLLYRMGRVPELNYLKFLELLGIELRAAEPAIAELAFPLSATAPQTSIIIPARTQVSAASPDSPAPLVFETDRATTAIKATLSSVQSFDGFAFSDASTTNKDAVEGFYPFGPGAGVDAALYLGFEMAAPFPQVELDLAFVAGDQGAPKYVSCNLPPSSRFASAALLWEFWTGTEWRALDLLSDETLALTKSGHVRLKTPIAGLMVPDVFGEVVPPRIWIRARILRAQYERAPRLLAVRTNTVSATQAQTVRDEVLGGSDGRANQIFRLGNAPVLRDTLRLEVDEGDGFAVWTEVDDFFGAGPHDDVYVLDRTTGEVRFGDGDHGAIPVGNNDLPGSNVVARLYRFGGGAAGQRRCQVDQDITRQHRRCGRGQDRQSVAGRWRSRGGNARPSQAPRAARDSESRARRHSAGLRAARHRVGTGSPREGASAHASGLSRCEGSRCGERDRRAGRHRAKADA